MKRPAVYFLFPYLMGILIGEFLSLNPKALLLVALIEILLTGLFFTRKKLAISSFCLGFTFFVLGSLMLKIENNYFRPDHLINFIKNYLSGRWTTIEGRIIKPLEYYSDTAYFYIRAEKIVLGKESLPCTGNLRVVIYQDSIEQIQFWIKEFQYLDKIRLQANLHLPENYQNPGCFDYQTFLARNGISVLASVSKPHQLRLIEPGEASILRSIYAYRQDLADFFEDNWQSLSAGLMKTLLLGDRTSFPDEIWDSFQKAGVAHILSVSGAHFGLVASVFFFLFYFASRTLWLALGARVSLLNCRYLAIILTALVIIFYAILTGARASTTRATIMILIFLGSFLFDRPKDHLNTLAIAAFFILIWSPSSLFDAGFQLSFAATWGIILVVQYLQEYTIFFGKDDVYKQSSDSFLRKIWRKFCRVVYFSLIVTLAASFAVSPLVAYYFSYFTFMGFFFNLIVIPVTGFGILPSGLLGCFLLPYAPEIAKFFLSICAFISNLLINLVQIADHFPFLCFQVKTPSLAFIFSYYATFFILLCWLDVYLKRKKQNNGRIEDDQVSLFKFNNLFKNNKPVLSSGLLFFFILTLILGLLPRLPLVYTNKNNLKAFFFDLHHAESALLQTPTGKNILIDAGGSALGKTDLSKEILLPFFKRQGIKKIDLGILSNFEPEHSKSFLSVLKELPISQIWLPEYKNIPSLAEEIIKQANFLNLPIKYISVTQNSNLQIKEQSLVLKIKYKEVSLLFTGDISKTVENELLVWQEYLTSTFLKAAYHGDKNSSSSSFLAAVSPQIINIPAATRNPFHQPSRETLDRYYYSASAPQIFRSDQDGMLYLETDGEKWELKTFKDLANLREKSFLKFIYWDKLKKLQYDLL